MRLSKTLIWQPWCKKTCMWVWLKKYGGMTRLLAAIQSKKVFSKLLRVTVLMIVVINFPPIVSKDSYHITFSCSLRKIKEKCKEFVKARCMARRDNPAFRAQFGPDSAITVGKIDRLLAIYPGVKAGSLSINQIDKKGSILDPNCNVEM